VDGLKDICVLKDPKISASLAEDAALVAGKKMTIEAFKKSTRLTCSISSIRPS